MERQGSVQDVPSTSKLILSFSLLRYLEVKDSEALEGYTWKEVGSWVTGSRGSLGSHPFCVQPQARDLLEKLVLLTLQICPPSDFS